MSLLIDFVFIYWHSFFFLKIIVPRHILTHDRRQLEPLENLFLHDDTFYIFFILKYNIKITNIIINNKHNEIWMENKSTVCPVKIGQWPIFSKKWRVTKFRLNFIKFELVTKNLGMWRKNFRLRRKFGDWSSGFGRRGAPPKPQPQKFRKVRDQITQKQSKNPQNIPCDQI